MLFIRGLSARKQQREAGLRCEAMERAGHSYGLQQGARLDPSQPRLLDTIQTGTSTSVRNGSRGVVSLSTVITERSKVLPHSHLELSQCRGGWTGTHPPALQGCAGCSGSITHLHPPHCALPTLRDTKPVWGVLLTRADDPAALSLCQIPH